MPILKAALLLCGKFRAEITIYTEKTKQTGKKASIDVIFRENIHHVQEWIFNHSILPGSAKESIYIVTIV